MANYADLKQRIITAMNRDDLNDVLASTLDQHIYDACEMYADMRFWFNQTTQSVSTVASANSVTLPSQMRIIDRLAGPYGDLEPVTLDDYPDYGTFASEAVGLPGRFTYLGGVLQFDLTPDQAYSMTAYGILQIDPPSNDSDTNAWTNEAAALISAHARMTLFRDQFRDEAGVGFAANALSMELTKLRRETERRLRKRLTARLVGSNGQPVSRSYLARL